MNYFIGAFLIVLGVAIAVSRRPPTAKPQEATVTPISIPAGVTISDLSGNRKRQYAGVFSWGGLSVDVEESTYNKRQIGMLRIIQNGRTVASVWDQDKMPSGVFVPSIDSDLRRFIQQITPVIERDFPK